MHLPHTTPELKRSMKLLGVLLLTLSSVTPAASVFIIAPGVVEQAGTGAVISFIAAAIICLFTAFVYAELASACPLTGGEYAAVARIMGPFAGFVVLGVNIMTLILIAAVVALGIADYVGVFLPGVAPVALGIGCVALTTLCGLLHIRTNAAVTGAFLVIELVLLIVIAALGFVHIERPFTELLFHPVHRGEDGLLQPVTLGMIGLATAVANFAYNGYGNAIYLGEEMHEAPRHLGRTIVIALLIAVVAEAVPVTAMLMGAPDLAGLLGSKNMLGDFITARGGMTMNTIVSLGIALAIINAAIAFLVLIARQIYSTGRDHVWHPTINHGLMKIHGRFHSPWVATLVAGGLSALACFIPMTMLLVTTGTSLVVVYGALCVAVMVGRKNGSTAHGLYRMPLFPLPPMLALVALAYVLYANYQDTEIGRPSLLATASMVVVSALYYWFVVRRRGEWAPRV